MPSKPDCFILAGKNPPHWLSPTAPVSGDLAFAVMRLWPEMGRPVGMPRNRVRMFSGESASTLGFISFKR